jgi:hypothetical protein
LIKKIGAGEIMHSELGTCNILPKPSQPSGELVGAPLYLRELTQNLLRWAKEGPSNGQVGVNNDRASEKELLAVLLAPQNL